MVSQLYVPLINPFTLVFGGLQIWWISGTLPARSRRLARPMRESEFRKSLEAIWAKRS